MTLGSINFHLRLVCLLAVLLGSGCMATLPVGSEPPTGTYRMTADTTYNFTHRSFLLHVPPGVRADAPLPLVVVLHGAFSSGGQTEMETGFSLLADRERFLVAYPEGIGLFGLLQHWNAGHCCGKAADDQVDDVAAVAEMISIIRQKVSVDPSRIYLAGMSNGGMLTYRFAAERAKVLAAAAVVCGAIDSSVGNEQPPWRLQAPGRPVPIMIIHGQDDETIPVNGGPFPVREGKRSYRATADAAEFWRTADGCAPAPVAMTSNTDMVKHLVWNSCLNNSSVEYFLLKGWGHQWPSDWFLERLVPDHPLRGFDATRKIWDFFVRFSNPDVK